MRFEDKFRELVLKSAAQFDDAAQSEPKIDSEDDNTNHGERLEKVYLAQKKQREELWAELHKLEEECKQKSLTTVFSDSLDPNRKKLALYVYEEAALSEELHFQEKGIDQVIKSDPIEISELKYRKRTEKTIDDLKETIQFMENQLMEAKATYEHEEIVLKECHQLHETLNEAIIQQRNMAGISNELVETHDKLASARDQYQEVMEYLVQFLDENYPPHYVDGVGLTDEPNPDLLCELKYILEDLMNRAVVNPGNPYITLEKGTFWSPYIETLIKSGVAERDPNSYLRIKLADFNLY
ncbi:centromere protein Cenp-K [Cunninghamella echinulata]|nr:centromere protein Cenp-K [Cunninghamella echinulata]